MNQDMVARARVRRARPATPLLVIGGVCGLAWAAGLRGFMAELAGSDSTVAWYGTFAQVLLPGLIAGALLGWAEHIRRTGGRHGTKSMPVPIRRPGPHQMRQLPARRRSRPEAYGGSPQPKSRATTGITG